MVYKTQNRDNADRIICTIHCILKAIGYSHYHIYIIVILSYKLVMFGLVIIQIYYFFFYSFSLSHHHCQHFVMEAIVYLRVEVTI